MPAHRIPDKTRIFRLTVRDGWIGCWMWQGSIHSSLGYGSMKVNGKGHGAHRVAYQTFQGPVPEGLVLDHLCRNRACVNPWHLEAVTQRVNVLRGDTLPARNAAKTHCPRGHPYDDENTLISRGRRHCRACKRKE